MHTAITNSAVLGIFSLAVSVLANQEPRDLLQKATELSSGTIQLSSTNIQSCEEAIAALKVDTTTLQTTHCYINSTTSGNPETALSGKPDITIQASGPFCHQDGIRPGTIDSQTLCEWVPQHDELPPAYSADTCACNVWSLGTARYAFCNCDPCASIAHDSVSAFCLDIHDDCILNDYARGYMSQYAPSAFWTLYGPSSNIGAPPVYVGC